MTTMFALCMVLLTCGNIAVNGNEVIRKNFQELLNAEVNRDAENHTFYRNVLKEGVQTENEEFQRTKDAIGAARLVRWPATLLEMEKKRRATNVATNSAPEPAPEPAPEDELNRLYEDEKTALQIEFKGRTNSADAVQDLIKRLALTMALKRRLERQFGKVDEQKAVLGIPVKKVKLRLTIESVVKDHYPDGKPAKLSYMHAFHELVVSKAVKFTERPDVMAIRKKISDSTIGTRRFLDVVKLLYSKLSDQGAHNLEGYGVVQLPTHREVDEIKKILESTVSPVHDDYVATVQLLLKPLPITSQEPAVPLEDLCCVRIEAQSSAEEAKLREVGGSIKDEDIHSVFPRSKGKYDVDDVPIKIDRIRFPNNDAKNGGQYVILVHFKHAKYAKKAFDHHTGYLDDVMISVHQSVCNGFPTTTTSTTTSTARN